MSGYTEEELALLSDEEREAIAADSTESERELLEAVAGDDDDDVGDDVQDGEQAGAAQAAEGEGADTASAAGGDGAAGGDDDKADFVPKYHAPAVEDYAAKLTALDDSFQTGDVELKDYNAQRDALVRQQLKAEIAAEQNAQVEEQLWQREISDFMDAHKEYGNKFRHAALDIAVKDLAADEANADKPGRWFLREAHKIVEREFGTQAKEQSSNDNPGEKPSRKPDLSVVPKTLAHLPAAELPDTGSVDEFAHLDRLTGLELESAVSRLSPAERERYRAA